MTDYNHKTGNTVDTLRFLGELEHHRFHLLMALPEAKEDEQITLLVLAKQCQELRRDIMRKHFDVEERHWCLIKSSARLLQIVEETMSDDVETLNKTKNIIDQTIEMATGEDISGCAACRADKNTNDLNVDTIGL